MNAKAITLAICTAIFLVILGFIAAYFAGYRQCAADNATRALEVQQSMAALGLVIQQQEAKQAELTRQQIITERERINAITTNDHQSAEIRQLETRLAQIIAEKAKNRPAAGNKGNHPANRYHIFDAAAIERVWNAASGSQWPDGNTTGAIQTRLPAITISTGCAWALGSQWRRLECTNKNQCWRLFRMPYQLQPAMAAM